MTGHTGHLVSITPSPSSLGWCWSSCTYFHLTTRLLTSWWLPWVGASNSKRMPLREACIMHHFCGVRWSSWTETTSASQSMTGSSPRGITRTRQCLSVSVRSAKLIKFGYVTMTPNDVTDLRSSTCATGECRKLCSKACFIIIAVVTIQFLFYSSLQLFTALNQSKTKYLLPYLAVNEEVLEVNQNMP